jgi:myo-inositol 2-dehydrogenase/D-chiro-inositol 1-dehydrogenase
MDARGIGGLNMALPLRAVQIGAGAFCERFHAPVLNKLATAEAPRVSLQAICDLDTERAGMFCRKFGYAHAYSDFFRMVDEQIPELIYCMVQPAATAAVLEKLLPMGIPIFTEKPPGVTQAEAERLAELAQQHKTMNYVAFNRRAMPGLLRLSHWASENGPIRYMRAEMLRNRRLEPEFGVGTAIHPLDYLRFLGGEVKDVVTRCRPYPGNEARDYLVRLIFHSGAIADLAVLVDCGLTRESYLVHAGSKMMEVALGDPYSSPFCGQGEWSYQDNTVATTGAVSDPLEAGGFLGEHNLFLDAVQSGHLPNCCLQDARHSLRLAIAVQQQYSGPLSQFHPELKL